MAELSSSNGVRVVGYAALAALALVARRRERGRATVADGVWPPFWWSTAAFLAALALARAGDIGSLMSRLGRGRAVEDGWYDSRRPIQAAVVAVVGTVWLLTVSIAVWRTPERRRRYLPVGVLLVTLAAFGAVRVVSLHHIDGVIHDVQIAGVRVGTVIEVALQVCTALAMCWVPVGRIRSEDSPAGVDRSGATQ